jgi:hypothetical protein
MVKLSIDSRGYVWGAAEGTVGRPGFAAAELTWGAAPPPCWPSRAGVLRRRRHLGAGPDQGGRALVRRPAGPGFVSLRGTVTDANGNTGAVTIIRAYRLTD